VTEEAATTVSSLDELRPKQELSGTIKKIEMFGAFVDVGVGDDGLLHISQVRKEHTASLEGVLEVGQEVTVWVRKVDAVAKRLDLTMIKPLAVEWNELKAGQLRTGKVTRIENFGAFVDIGAERPGMVHVRELAAGYVRHPSEVVSLGDEVEVKVIGVDRKQRKIDLSMRALDEEDMQAADEDEAPAQTAMEIALRSAMGAAPTGRDKRRKKKRRMSGDREDVLRRTLEQHADD